MKQRRWRPVLIALSGLLIGPSIAVGEPPAEWMKGMVQDPQDPRLKPMLALRRKQVAFERDLKKLRAKHFRSEHAPTRAEGLVKLEAFSEGWMIQPLVEVFQDERGADVRGAIVAKFRGLKGDEGDRALTWLAVSNHSPEWQASAVQGLRERLADLKQDPSEGMLAVLQTAVLTQDQFMADSAAATSAALNLYEMIPFLIQAQAGAAPQTNALGRPRNGPLAWIAIAQQQAYIADLNPLVADNTVVFDPVPGVVSSGVVLVINDAVAHFSPLMINRALMDLSSRAGSKTSDMGLRFGQWVRWYQGEGKDEVAAAAAKRREEAAAKAAEAEHAEKPATTPTAPTAPAQDAKPSEPSAAK